MSGPEARLPMPRPPQGGAGTENEDELGAMPTTTGAGEPQEAASAADPAGLAEIIAKAKERAAVAAGQAQRLATNASESATKHSASLRAQAASTAAEMTSSVATADARARLVTDAKVKALTMTASAHQQVVRGQAMRGVVPAGIVAERLGIEYEDAEGNPLPGYDTELVVALRQLDTTAAVLKSLVEIGEQTHAASESLAFSHSQIGAAATAEGARLEAMPPADRSPGPVRPAPQVTQAEAYYTALVGELGDAYSALGESSAALAGSVGPMRERAQVIGAKVSTPAVSAESGQTGFRRLVCAAGGGRRAADGERAPQVDPGRASAPDTARNAARGGARREPCRGQGRPRGAFARSAARGCPPQSPCPCHRPARAACMRW